METLSFKYEELERYLSFVFKTRVKVLYVGELGEERKTEKELKGFGYGVPYLIEFLLGDRVKKVVLETVRPGGFGHEHFSDRAQILLWQHSAFNKLPRHVRAVDVGAFTSDGTLKSVGDCVEFFILTDLVEGQPYYLDLERMKSEKTLNEMDLKRCRALSEYIAEVHAVKKKGKDGESLYVRRMRELLGHGECIMGLTDSYPSGLDYVDEDFLKLVEKKCIDWRWKLKKKAYRCSRVHGDFHPWNILFREGVDFTALDRSRGEWGEPADDVACLSINYIFYGLQTYEKLDGPFEKLFNLFLDDYLDRTGDEEIFSVIQPFYVWRALVIASPIWYPDLSYNVRRRLFNFIRNLLETEEFDPKQVNLYLE
ncbi:MAG: phosphotransferase [Candidatus Bathyarchaeia archaeon]